ncbi:MAG: rod shape-determining protein MreC [Pegethrix bostrychoides GSE-TBD4-15B]|jgi:rod shape-determining protein MreC|uniref:Cell shape-determining protein MreC n=1 Tax=Pegethrix bostrychoides GSE-TBD4-15B TaxID=2839662 RepID=A0A951PE15_9CYAN|nr:rod shape-determining protein MreC [Pegethrix bostrychoides GSE-TBD4-15B]
MYAIRRWWDRNSIRFGLIGLALGSAWLIRQTQGSLIYEAYRGLSQPFGNLPAETAARKTPTDPRTLELEQRLVELESQNQKLQALLGEVTQSPTKGQVAAVIGRSADHWWQQITLGRGQQDDIKIGAIVSGEGGLVGRVVQVTPNTSRVLLISDPTSQLGVTVSRSRNMGYIRGQSANRVIMEFFDKVPDVRPGDVISTSSYSQLFPAGLPVGIVESVNLNRSPAPEAVIELSAPISRLEWVVVTPNPKAESALLPSGKADSNAGSNAAE